MQFRTIKDQFLSDVLSAMEGLDSDQLVQIRDRADKRLGCGSGLESEAVLAAGRQLLQFRPLALKQFEDIAVTGKVLGFYYDLSNEVTPALFVVIERNNDEETEVIRLEGSEWKRP